MPKGRVFVGSVVGRKRRPIDGKVVRATTMEIFGADMWAVIMIKQGEVFEGSRNTMKGATVPMQQ